MIVGSRPVRSTLLYASFTRLMATRAHPGTHDRLDRERWERDDRAVAEDYSAASRRAGCRPGGRSLVRMEAVRRELRGSALALVLVAATTLVAYVLIQSFDVRRGSVIYLLPVLLAGWHPVRVPALVAAVAGVL